MCHRDARARPSHTSVILPRVIDPNLAAYGLDDRLAEAAEGLLGSAPPGSVTRMLARISSEDRLGYDLVTARGELRGVLPGKMRRAAANGELDKPSVGDWVVVEDRPGVDGMPVLAVVPRRTKLSRKAAGRDAVEQVVGANVDVAFLVTSLDGDVSVRRLERYRALCEEGRVAPVVVLTKSDLAVDPSDILSAIAVALPGVPVLRVSNVTGEGLEALDAWLVPGRTVAVLGSSGVGKSTLVNRWVDEAQATARVDARGKGRHTTTARSLFRARNGAILLDTPGMRELALWEADEGVRATFGEVEAIAAQCRFSDCAHEGEPGCAIAAALADRTLSPERLGSWQKLRAELAGQVRRTRREERSTAQAIRARLRQKGR